MLANAGLITVTTMSSTHASPCSLNMETDIEQSRRSIRTSSSECLQGNKTTEIIFFSMIAHDSVVGCE